MRPREPATPAHSRTGIQDFPVRDHIFMLQGAGANITASVGRDGVLLVDAGRAPMSEEVLAAVRRCSSELDLRDQPPACGAETRSSVAGRNSEAPAKPVRYIIDTQRMASTPVATRSCEKRGGRSPAATSPATSPTPPKAPRSSPTRTCCSG